MTYTTNYISFSTIKKTATLHLMCGRTGSIKDKYLVLLFIFWIAIPLCVSAVTESHREFLVYFLRHVISLCKSKILSDRQSPLLRVDSGLNVINVGSCCYAPATKQSLSATALLFSLLTLIMQIRPFVCQSPTRTCRAKATLAQQCNSSGSRSTAGPRVSQMFSAREKLSQ